MPIIKTYQSNLTERGLNAPKAQYSANAGNFGGYRAKALQNFGQGVENLGNTMADVQLAEQVKLNKATSRDALNTARSEDRDYVNALFAKKGKDATAVYEEGKEYFEKQKKARLSKLEKKQQQELFGPVYDDMVNRNLDALLSHQMAQTEKYDKETTVAQIANAVSDAAVNRDDPEEVKAYISEAKAKTAELYDHLGPGVVKKEVLAVTTKAYGDVIDNLIADKDISAAKLYFSAYNDQISGDAQDVIKKKLKAAELAFDSRKNANSIIKGTPDYEEQLKKVNNIEDPEVAAATRAYINAAHQDQLRVKAEKRAASLDERTGKVMDAKSLTEALDIINSDTSEYVGKEADRISLTKLAKARFNTSNIKTNDVKLSNLYEQIDLGKIKSKEDLILLARPISDDGDFTKVMNYYTTGGNKGTVSDSNLRTHFKTLSGKEVKGNEELYEKTRRYVMNNLDPGMKATDEMITRLMSKVLAEGEVKSGSIFLPNWDKRLIEVIGTKDEKAWEPDKVPFGMPADAKWNSSLRAWTIVRDGKLLVAKE